MASTKLTLNLEAQVLEKAKRYAAEQGMSVSKMVEKYLKSVPDTNQPIQGDDDIADWVKRLRVSDKPTPDFDNKEEYRNHIIEKYSR